MCLCQVCCSLSACLTSQANFRASQLCVGAKNEFISHNEAISWIVSQRPNANHNNSCHSCPGRQFVLCLTWSKAINLWIKLWIAHNSFNLLRYWFFFLPSFYTVNEVHKFQYSRPVRKGEKDPDNEFAVIPVFFCLFVYCYLLFPHLFQTGWLTSDIKLT